MTKSEMILKVAGEAKIRPASAKRAINCVVKSVVSSLKEGNSITVAGLGTFRVKATNPRKGRNPKTGESIEIPASRRVSFKPGSGLKRIIKS